MLSDRERYEDSDELSSYSQENFSTKNDSKCSIKDSEINQGKKLESYYDNQKVFIKNLKIKLLNIKKKISERPHSFNKNFKLNEFFNKKDVKSNKLY